MSALAQLAVPYAHVRNIAIAVVIVFAALHSSRMFLGFDACEVMLGSKSIAFPLSMFTQGSWYGEKWSPAGCVLDQFAKGRLPACLDGKRVVFAGDSRMRDLFVELALVLNPKFNASSVFASYHSNQKMAFKGVTLEFIWQPENLFKAVDKFRKSDLIVLSEGLWTLKKTSSVFGLDRVLVRTIAAVAEVAPEATAIWVPLGAVDEEQLREDRKVLTNKLLSEYDAMTQKMLEGTSITYAGSIAHLLIGAAKNSEDGLHYPSYVSRAENSIILNSFCGIAASPGTCCGAPEPVVFTQWTALALMAICGLVWWAPISGALQRWVPGPALSSVFSLGIIMFYCFLCDRTDVFMKEEKHFSALWLAASLIGVVVVGALTWTPCSAPGLLNRDQTDEWKGWMQLFILAYHYCGASAVLPVYVFVRVLVAAYLFQTGYGHFLYFNKNSASPGLRISQIVIRLNMLVVALCWVMHRPYAAYYFVPLCTFWFLAVCAVMTLAPSANTNTWLLMAKLAALIALCAAGWFTIDGKLIAEMFFSLPVVFQIFAEKNSVKEWCFRWGLDRFATPFGMVFAFATVLFARNKSIQQRVTSQPAVTAMAVAGAAVFVAYVFFATGCGTKAECNESHAWTSLFLIAAFIALRNATEQLRSGHSAIIAFCGKISLELFLAQYHMWLANDTRSLLVFVPGHPLLNALLTTPVFFVAAHELSEALNGLVGSASKSQPVRNACILLLLATLFIG